MTTAEETTNGQDQGTVITPKTEEARLLFELDLTRIRELANRASCLEGQYRDCEEDLQLLNSEYTRRQRELSNRLDAVRTKRVALQETKKRLDNAIRDRVTQLLEENGIPLDEAGQYQLAVDEEGRFTGLRQAQ